MAVSSKLSQVFTYESWVHAMAGASGGCIAMLTFYPLDTVRSRLQIEDPDKNGDSRSTIRVIKDIVLNEGFPALYQGLGPVLQSLCISNFIYFYAFHSLKALTRKNLNSQNIYKDLILGSIAGIINVLLTTPFWVVNTRLRMQCVSKTTSITEKHYNDLLNGLKYVAKTEGAKGLWSGMTASLVLVSNPALQFMMYELLKRNLHKTPGVMSSIKSFAIGALAKAFATILTYPLQLVQTKQRHRVKVTNVPVTSKRSTVETEYQSTLQMLWNIVQSQGIKGLFRGMEAKILQTVLTAALMFMAYEKINTTVHLLLLQNKQKYNSC